MEITHAGGSSFVLKGERVVAINPESAGGTDIRLYSTRRTKGKYIVNGPGEYEIGSVLIVTLCPDRESGSLVHAVTIDGVTVLYIDGSSARFTDVDVMAIGPVDVLIIGSTDLKTAEAIVMDIVPRMTLPYGENAFELCTMLGVTDPQPQAKLSWNGASSAPKAIVLRETSTKKKAA